MRQIFAVVRYQFLGFFKNPRVILSFSLGLIASFLLSTKVIEVAQYYQVPMQAAEPFIWTFGDMTSILLVSLLLLLMFSDLPKLSPVSPYYLHRITKKKWLAAQVFYVIACTALYVGFILAVTVFLCIRYTFIGNMWSETAAMLGYSKLGETMMVPSTVKVMESITPYGCMVQVVVLLFFYALTLGFVILWGNLAFGRRAGMVAGLGFCLYGFLLNPKVLGKILGLEEFEMYKVRVFAGWVSPLNHAVYGMHDFGYDLLPSVGQSVLVFLGLLLLLYGMSVHVLGGYDFVFGGGNHG
ncbi:MAG: hypothetical protein ACOYBE_05815 [Blautia sp.]|jgi:hypothetical protein